MPSAFAELEALVSDEVDAHFGEPTRVAPKAKTSRYFAGGADGARASIVVTGIVDFDPVTLISQDTGKYDGSRPAVASDKIHVSYAASVFTDWQPKQGDVIVLIDRTPSERLLISRADPDGLGRIVCVCTRAPDEA